MRLYEYEGKQILQQAGLNIPPQLALATLDELSFQQACVLKAQVLFGNRAAQDLVLIAATSQEFTTAKQKISTALQKQNLDPATVKVLVEPLLQIEAEIYLSIRYDTATRQPTLNLQLNGGSGIEQKGQTLQSFILNDIPPSLPKLPKQIKNQLSQTLLKQLITTFWENDLTLLEINPIALVGNQFFMLDAKLETDDTAAFRHDCWKDYPSRTLFAREPTLAEKKAKQINTSDHRGVAGASYFDFNGSIAILAAGGGASILAMDTLLHTDLKPANYTEYSGNPTREKVAQLTQLVLKKPSLEALWVVGGHANFTDQFETLMGVFDGLAKSSLPARFPVVIRRGGPRLEEAFAALRSRSAQLNLDLHLFDSTMPITQSAFALEKAVQQFRSKPTI